MTTSERVVCPGCGLAVTATAGRYDFHRAGSSVRPCFMTGMPLPVKELSEEALKERVRIVACLAQQVQEDDPAEVWHYLTAVPAWFVQELLQFALAAIPVEGKEPEAPWRKWYAA